MSRALLLSPDDQAVSAITGVLEEMAVSCERPLDGVSAAQKLNSHNFDLVLVDCENLPAAKLIFDVCRRGKGGSTPVPIAIVDGRAGLPTAFRLGAELILTKPVSKDHARSTIRTAVSRVRKEEPAQPTSPADVPSNKTVPQPSEVQAAAAVATAMTVPVAATPQAAKVVESVPAVAVAAEPPRAPAAPMSATVEEVPAPPPAPPVRPATSVAPSRLSKRPLQISPGFKPAPEEKLSDDFVLAEIDKGELGKVVRQAPVLSSFNSPSFNPPQPKKRGGPVLLLLLLLAGGGFYAAWMYQPGFRELAEPQIERVTALVEQVTQRSARPQPKAPVPTQNEIQAPAATAQPAVAANQTPVNNASTPLGSPETVAAVPASGATSAATTAAAGTNPAPATTPATSSGTAEGLANSGNTAASLSLDKPTVMDKNVVILSSKGAEKRLVHKVPPVYPKEAKVAGLEGTVVMKTLVSDSGKVVSVSLVEGNPILAAPAIHAVKQWRYRPYVRDGKNLAFQTIVLLDFQRQ